MRMILSPSGFTFTCASSQLAPRTSDRRRIRNMAWFSKLLAGLARVSALVREDHLKIGELGRHGRDSRMIVPDLVNADSFRLGDALERYGESRRPVIIPWS